MSALRAVLGAAGVAAVAWGALLLLDRPDALGSVLVWAAGGVLVHDLVVAPVSIVVGALLARVLPAGARAPVLLLVAGWALVGVAVGNVLSGQGGKPDNPSLLTGSYVAAWSVLTLVVAVVALVVVLRTRQRRTRHT